MAIQLPHTGSWGTWDLGISELAAKILGEKSTSQGGSDLSRSWASQQPTNTAPDLFGGNTGGASGSWGSPTTTAPTTRTGTPTNVPSTPQVPTSTQNVPSNDDFNRQLDELYRPGMDLLGRQEQAVRSQGATAQQGLQDQSTYLQQMLDSQVKQSQGQVSDQQRAIEEGKRSALSQARSTFNALQQQTASRFGQGNGAGAFISELQGQELMRNNAQINSGYTDSMKAINDYANRVQEASFTEYQRIQREFNTGKKAIDDEMNNRLLAIGSDRTQLESAKTQQKVDLLRSALENARNMANARDTALFNLNLWKEQQQTMLTSSINSLQNDYSQTLQSQAGNIDAATSEKGFSNFGGGTTKDGQQTTTYRNPYLTKTQDDENNAFDVSQYFA